MSSFAKQLFVLALALCLAYVLADESDRSPCPPGVPIVKCIADPCRVTKCSAYPNATCRSNYCGGCNAVFYVNGAKVNCSSVSRTPTTTGPRCPPNKPPVKCFRDPCQGATCSVPGAKCVSDYCGGCFARWYLGGRLVNCTAPSRTPTITATPTGSSTKCPPNKPPVNCFRNPCQGLNCSIPGAKCVPDYCGGCFAKWYVGRVPVTCPKAVPQVGVAICPKDVVPVNCFVDPCQVTKCAAFPKAECVANYCGGCAADFRVDGKLVKC